MPKLDETVAKITVKEFRRVPGRAQRGYAYNPHDIGIWLRLDGVVLFKTTRMRRCVIDKYSEFSLDQVLPRATHIWINPQHKNLFELWELQLKL